MNATRATAVGDLAALHPALSILHEMYPNHELREIDPIVFASNPTVLPSSIQCYVQRRDVVLFLRRTASNAYLFKVLDVRDMASIQAHPTRAQAEEGFSRENAAGIPIDAPQRLYRDENHKPEVHAVLTDFWMLHGFRPLEEIAEVLSSELELAPLAAGFSENIPCF